MNDTVPVSLGQRLRELRGDIGLRELARRAGVSHAMLSNWESGTRTPSGPEYLVKVLDALGVENPERERLLAMAHRPGPGEVVAGVPAMGQQLAQLIGYERTTTAITDVALALIPGILQTRSYAQAVLSAGPETGRRVRMRVERAEILTRSEDPVEFRAFIHVEALTRPVAPPEVMREQMLHLLDMAELPNVTIQVVPADVPGWVPSLAGPFMVLEFSDAPTVVHLEHLRAGVFLWDYDDVRGFMAAADEMAQKAMTPARTAEVIAGIARSHDDGT